uniref:Fold protein n=1 Tax=Fagus sylvatica TaxID=28930 RepID=A0A2N9FXF7_FAGSY
MASDETMTTHSSMQEDDDYQDDIFDGFDHDQHPNPLNLSRLSVCTNNSMFGNYEDEDEDEDDGDNIGMRMFMSRLSIESFDADEEFSDDDDKHGLSSDSDNEPGCYSLPATPPRRRNRGSLLNLHQQVIGVKEYASENEAQKGVVVLGRQNKMKKNNAIRRRRRIITSWDNFDHCNNKDKNNNWVTTSVSGESDQGGVNGGAGLMVITRPKGGRRSLCMDLDEVKACRDLGFELEHERMLEIPSSSSRRSISGSTLEYTSSGGNSPIANWRISSPGDDPRDVKARLKVWAQAVAIASASPRQGSSANCFV